MVQDPSTRLGILARALCDPENQPHQWTGAPEALIREIIDLVGCPGPAAAAWEPAGEIAQGIYRAQRLAVETFVRTHPEYHTEFVLTISSSPLASTHVIGGGPVARPDAAHD